MPKVLREFIKLFGPLALGICLATLWFVHTRNDNHRKIVSLQQESVVVLDARVITRHVASHASDARFLARLVGRKLASTLDDTTLRGLEDDFADFARSRDTYFQLRFLDATGMERIRLSRSFAGPVILPRSAMQNKEGRYYFRASIAAKKDTVYVSHFDLNMEHGEIEKPHRPTLRYVCPVIDASGKARGVVVLNYNGAPLLNQIESQAASGYGRTMITTGKGYWILGPTADDAWGHILKDNKDASMPNRFPDAWKRISANEKGQLLTDQGLFTFDTIGIIPGDFLTDSPPSTVQAALRWKIISWVAPDQLTVPWMTLFIVLVFLFILVLSVGCWYLASYRVRQSEVEARLRDSEERTLAISQSAQDAIAMVDDEDKVTYWNPAAERLLGYTASEMMGQSLHKALAPAEMRPQARQSMTAFASSGKGEIVGKLLEFEALHKDGSLIPVELAVSSFMLKGRWYAVGSMRDITRRKRDEAALIRSNETNTALINAPTESALLIKPDGTLLAINKIAAQRLSVDPETIIGQSIHDLLPPEIAEPRKAMIDSVVKSGKPVQFEDTRDGMRLLNNIYPSKRADGSIDRIAIFSRNVTEQHKAKQALVDSEQRFRDVSEAISEFIWETDSKGRIQFLTEDVESVLGHHPSELLGRSPGDLVIEDDSEDYKKWYEAVVVSHTPFTNVELQYRAKDERIVWLQGSGVPYYDDNGEFQGYRGAAMDVTDRKEVENAIKASERKLRALAESAYDAIIMIDTNGLVSFWNHAATELFGYTEEEVMGKEVHSLIAPTKLREQAEKGMYQFAMTGNGPALGKVEETTGLRKDGTEVVIERSVSGFRLANEWFAVATIRDITDRKATEAELTRLATTDSLTGLNNRRRFMELAEAEFARSLRYDRPLSLLMLDIDHFKNVNDTHGHDVGDDVLRSLSEVAVLALRNADIVGRLGGEEFGVILPETGDDAAMEVAERLRVSVERSNIVTNAGELKITISLGLANLNPATRNLQELLKRADVALYDAKQTGRNRTTSG